LLLVLLLLLLLVLLLLLLLLQVSYSVMDRRPSLFLARFCEARDIPLLAYGTLGGGLLSERYLDVPANM
jgi:aryl-alcohol dehydrogenase-like predicted oxidoreductase